MIQSTLDFGAAPSAADWLVSHRRVANHWVATAHVDGVGAIHAHHRSLWTAVQMVRAEVAAALIAQPQEMF